MRRLLPLWASRRRKAKAINPSVARVRHAGALTRPDVLELENTDTDTDPGTGAIHGWLCLASPPVARDRETQTQGPLASRAPGRVRPARPVSRVVMLLVSRGKSKGRVHEPAAACRPRSTFHETIARG